ncbi:hypothetical protein P4V41_07880 [Fictibacillus nanhaiensis]|uniref:hypothetical protein n=1 Tax=Fictibacillus nanhaiensis TaxID=742169 RepID=UPI002E21A99C|nr:hypothetical protein [Fictibacillus nanhaiensis]
MYTELLAINEKLEEIKKKQNSMDELWSSEYRALIDEELDLILQKKKILKLDE